MMNAAAGIFLAARRKPKLPYDAEVEYIQKTDTQWILAVAGPVDNTFGLWAEYSMDRRANNYPAGFSTTQNGLFLAPGAVERANWRYGWHTIGTSGTSPSYPYTSYPYGLDNYHEVKMNWLNGGKISMDDSGDSSITGYGGNFTGTDFLLFPSYTDVGKVRFKFAKISKGGDVIRDFVPVRFTNELGKSEGAMYDRVSGQLFRNAGTGSFTIGPDKTA